MKDFFKYFGLLILVVFSFYYTDRISNLIIYKSSLMKQILENKDNYNQDYVNAVISDGYIVPGLNGRVVNEKDSYYQMKSNNGYDESLYVFSQLTPDISLTGNENLIIKKANPYKNAVCLIVDSNQKVVDYLDEQKIIYTSTHNLPEKYHIQATYQVTNDLSYEVSSGDIIFISDNLTINNLKYLIKKINYQDLKIVSIESLISEER